jgi:DNA-binding NtrC family response regulator
MAERAALSKHNEDDAPGGSLQAACEAGNAYPAAAEIVLLEDDVMLRAAMALALQRHGLVVHALGAAEHVRRVLGENGAIVGIIMEIGLGGAGGEGRALLADVKKAWPGMAIVVLTGRPDLLLGHATGPHEAHLLKPCPMQRVVTTIRGLITTR